ncbi:hypothetical protein H3N56_03420 [Cetobacterium sp. 2A]|uniref:hypothetical protein n=1 Tax=Cetobacterium sp. 2A TaxID=2754723 RepID=UPI00163CECBC|nr:hypothetical protein [Cetobacterium sp. 2A]MBC2855545.1 hypothetical protein [Cetobacterium sp. 2A]
MKKIIFALFALSALSFGAEPVDTATVPVNVSAIVSGSPATQLVIVDEGGTAVINRIDITHELTVDDQGIITTAANLVETSKFKVSRGTPGTVVIGKGKLNFALSAKKVSLEGVLESELTIPESLDITTDISRTEAISLVSTISQIIEGSIIEAKTYTGAPSNLTVTYDKTITPPTP